MLDDADQRSLAKRMRPILSKKGIEIVFVGSTAIVGLDLFQRTSKDADALATPDLTVQEARRRLQEIAKEEGLDVLERGWGTVALAELDEEGNELWAVDVLVPKGGVIPERAAARIHEKAQDTDIGPTAIPTHILAMKAIAYGDSIRKAEQDRAQAYENDLLQLEKELEEGIDWGEVEALLKAFPSTRSKDAAGKIHEVFGKDLGYEPDPDPSIT